MNYYVKSLPRIAGMDKKNKIKLVDRSQLDISTAVSEGVKGSFKNNMNIISRKADY